MKMRPEAQMPYILCMNIRPSWHNMKAIVYIKLNVRSIHFDVSDDLLYYIILYYI